MLQLFQNDADLQGEHRLADGGFLDFEVLAQENAQVTHRRRQLLYAGGFQLREQRLAVPAQSGLVKRDVALDDVEVVVELELVHILREGDIENPEDFQEVAEGNVEVALRAVGVILLARVPLHAGLDGIDQQRQVEKPEILGHRWRAGAAKGGR